MSNNKIHLKSDQVHVFPFGSTRKVDPTARVMNEQNISQLVRNLTDISNYVIEFDSNTKVMSFCIQGYYFRANLTEVYIEGSPLYSYIILNTATIQDGDKDNIYEYLYGGDTDGIQGAADLSSTDTIFTGLTFVYAEAEIPNNSPSLYLLDENGDVPQESYRKFLSKSIKDINEQIKIDIIYCGTATEVID